MKKYDFLVIENERSNNLYMQGELDRAGENGYRIASVHCESYGLIKTIVMERERES